MLIAAADVADEPSTNDGLASLKELLDCEPGPAMITYLNCLDLDALDDVSHMIAMELVERQQSWLAELAVRITAKVASPTPTPDPDRAGYDVDDFSAELVAASLGLAPGGARMRVEIARRLTEALPMCQAAMAAGDLSYHHAWVLVEATAQLDPAALAAVDVEIASRVRGQNWTAFRRTLRRALLAAAPDLAEAEHADALNKRAAEVTYIDANGMGEIRATMSAVDAHTVWLGLDTAGFALQLVARAAGESDAGIDAYRSDALVAWATAALSASDAPKRHGRLAQLQVVIDLPSLLGLAENPAELNGYGPISAAVARELAVDAEWRRLVVDPVTGYLLDYGSVIYRPPQKLKDFIVARDRRCRFPGCRRHATHCDIDHSNPAPKGSTSSANCCCLCRRHHRLKTVGGWKLELLDGGSCRWTPPNGRRFVCGPPAQLAG